MSVMVRSKEELFHSATPFCRLSAGAAIVIEPAGDQYGMMERGQTESAGDNPFFEPREISNRGAGCEWVLLSFNTILLVTSRDF